MENMHLKLISLLVKCLTFCFSVLISSILFKEKKKTYLNGDNFVLLTDNFVLRPSVINAPNSVDL